MDYYTAHSTWTRKGYHKSANWQHVGQETIAADTHRELIDKLKDKYGKSWNHKKPIYRDRPNAEPVRCGWVVGFRVEDQDRSARDGVYRCLEQDWITFSEDTSSPITGKALRL